MKAAIVLIMFLNSYDVVDASEAEYNQVFADSVIVSVTTLISEPRYRVLNIVKGAFSSGDNYILNGRNVFYNTTQSLFWNMKSSFQGVNTVDWLMAGFSDGKFIAYANPKSSSKSDGTLLRQENRNHSLIYYENSTHPRSGKINGPQSSNQTYDCTGRPWYLKSLTLGNTWSDPYAFIDDGALGLTAVIPMSTASGTLLGVAGVDYRLVVLDEYFASLVLGTKFTIFIVESSGLMIASSVPGAAVDGVNQVRSNSSDVLIIKEIGLKIQTEFENNWTRADGVVLTVNTESEGIFFARSSQLDDGYGLRWHVIVAESVSCDVGFFISARGGSKLLNDVSVCHECERGAECVGGDYLPYPKRGYWMDLDSKKIKGSIYSCSWDTCLGFDQKVKLDYDNMYATLLDLCWSTTSDRQNSSLCDYDDLMCMEGSTGPMCGSCKENWRFSSSSQLCEGCYQVFWVEPLLSTLVIVLIALLRWLFYHDYVSCPPQFEDLKLRMVSFVSSIDRGALKVLWSTYQIAQSISFSINIAYPYPYSEFQSYLSFLNLDFLNIECLNGNYLQSVVISSLFPFGLAVVCWLVFLARVWYNVVQFDLRDRHLKALLAHHCHISLLIIYVVVPPVTNQQFKALACQEISDDQSYLRVDTSVDCNSDYYRRFVLVDALMIAAYQALSLLYITLLCRVRHKLNPIAPNKVLALHIRDSDESLDPIRFLFADYKQNFWYFEIADLYRRIMFISILPLVSQRSLTKAYFGCILSLFSTVYFREAMPYRVEFTNFIAVIAQYVILLDFMAALMVSGLTTSNTSSASFLFFGFILVAINLLIVLMAIYLTRKHFLHAELELKQGKEKELKIEWAVEFSSNKFQTTLQYVIERGVPSSHILCYYYTTLAQARESLKLNMIPATVEEDGIMVSLKGPMEIAEGDLSLELMGERAHSYEAVLCLDLPKHALFKVASRPGLKKRMKLRLIPRDLIFAFGVFVPPEKKKINLLSPSSSSSSIQAFANQQNFNRILPNHLSLSSIKSSSYKHRIMPLVLEENGDVDGPPSSELVKSGGDINENSEKESVHGTQTTKKPEWSHILKLDLSCALRAYQLKHEENCKSSTISWSSSIIKPSLLRDPTLMDVINLRTLLEYTDEMKSIRQECSEEGTIPLYHYTSIQVARSIFDHGFRMSTQGQGDGGVYFSTLGPASYDVGSIDYEDNIIVDCFGKERLEEYRGKGQLDVCFVYGVNPKLIEPAPGGRNNAVMVSKDLFETFGVLSYGCYYLRPDYIKGAFLFNSVCGIDTANDELSTEVELDKTTCRELRQFYRSANDENELSRLDMDRAEKQKQKQTDNQNSNKEKEQQQVIRLNELGDHNEKKEEEEEVENRNKEEGEEKKNSKKKKKVKKEVRKKGLPELIKVPQLSHHKVPSSSMLNLSENRKTHPLCDDE